MRFRPRTFRVRVGSERWEGSAWLVAVGNTRTYGGGMAITPGAELDDGLLDVCVVTAVSRLELFAKFLKVFKGTHVHHPAILSFRGPSVTIEAPDATAPLDLWASGDCIGPLPAEVSARPGALRVLVPADSPLSTSRLPAA